MAETTSLIAIGTDGDFPDYPVEGEVKKDVEYGKAEFKGTYDPGGTFEVRIEDEGVQIR